MIKSCQVGATIEAGISYCCGDISLDKMSIIVIYGLI
jgi:hypothetical protein